MSELLLPPEHRYAKRIKEQLNEDGSELSMLNLGPTHPATHGIFQNILLMDGERILEAEPTIGYIHRAFEKIAENRALSAEHFPESGGTSRLDAGDEHHFQPG